MPELFLQIRLDFRLVSEVVRDDGVHVDQRNRWVLLRDLLGGGAGLERADDSFERDPGTRHAHDAVIIGVDGHPLEDVHAGPARMIRGLSPLARSPLRDPP